MRITGPWNMNKNLCFPVFYLVLLILLLLLPCLHVKSKTRSIRLSCTVEREGKQVNLVGDEFALYKIADAVVSDQGGQVCMDFITLESFMDYDCDWNSLSASQVSEKAKAMAEFVLHKEGAALSEISNESGEVLFNTLDTGLYLIIRSKIAEENKEYVEEPILVSLPQIIDGISYDEVHVEPKFLWKTHGTPTDPNNPVSAGDTPSQDTETKTPGQDEDYDSGSSKKEQNTTVIERDPVISNPLTSIVKTGDDSKLRLYYAGMAGSLAAFILLVLFTYYTNKMKRRTKDKCKH